MLHNVLADCADSDLESFASGGGEGKVEGKGGWGGERSQLHVDVLYFRISSLPGSNTHPSHFPPQFPLLFLARWMVNYTQTRSRLTGFVGSSRSFNSS